ncbi:MAG: hypothetical protein HOQ24_05220, partial [Mycobacteriaceae bacterium]|nr:hypothetical protein [Mycobacteriaceae bacterium]
MAQPEADSATSNSTDCSGLIPLSRAQYGMWFAHKLSPERPPNIAQYVEIRGAVDEAAFAAAVQAAGAELESPYLRITEIDGRPFQWVDTTQPYHGAVVDLTGTADPVAAAQEWMRGDYSAPVDLRRDPLATTKLLRLADNHYYWYSRVHHVATDGYGGLALTARAAHLYTALVTGTQAAARKSVGLADIYRQDSAYRESPRFSRDRAYWRERTADLPPAPRPAGRSAPPT